MSAGGPNFGRDAVRARRVSATTLAPAGYLPRSARFRKERERDWQALESMVNKASSGRGLHKLSADEAERFPALYRATLSALSVARDTAMDRELVRYLEALCRRAHLLLYGSPAPGRMNFFRALRATMPQKVRHLGWELLLSTGIFFLGAVVAYVLVMQEDNWFHAFINPAYASGRDPEASTQSLREAIYSKSDGSGLSIFAAWLFTHNARIGITAFALGFAAGIPTALLLFTNGTVLGAFVALHHQRDLLVPILGWLLPHGVPEILAVLLCGAAGFHIGRGSVLPGKKSVARALSERGRSAAMVVGVAVLLFFYAGGVEGIFRQTVNDDVIRFLFALFNAVWIFGWLVLGGSAQRDKDGERS